MDPTDLTVDDLADCCSDDTQKYHRQQPNDPRFCFELLRRALAGELSDAFTHVYRIYEPQVRRWIFGHSGFSKTGESADYFVSASLSAFYFALRGDSFERFDHLAQLLAYLKMCVHTSIAQYLRSQDSAEITALDDANPVGQSGGYDRRMDAAALWALVCNLLPEKEDQLVAHCAFVQALKPSEIARMYPEQWGSAREVSVALQRVRRRLRRDAELRAWAGVKTL